MANSWREPEIDPFLCVIIMMHVVNVRDKQDKKVLEEKEKTGKPGCAKIKHP